MFCSSILVVLTTTRMGFAVTYWSYLPRHEWVLQGTKRVLVLLPEHPLAPGPEGGGLLQVRVSTICCLPVPHVLEHEWRLNTVQLDHPPCTATVGWLVSSFLGVDVPSNGHGHLRRNHTFLLVTLLKQISLTF